METIEKDDYVKYTGCSKEQVRWETMTDPEPFLVLYYNQCISHSHPFRWFQCSN